MITDDARRLTSSIEDDLRYCEVATFDTNEMLMVHVALEKLYEKYNVSKKETTALNVNFDVDRQNESDLAEFITDLVSQGSKQTTCDQYERNLRTYMRWFDNRSLREATEQDIKDYLRYRQDVDKISAATAEQNRSILYSFYTYLHSREYIAVHPMVMIPLIKFKHKERVPLTKTELEQVRKACKSERDRAIVEVLYSTGARVNEIANVHMSDVNLANRTIFIREPKGFKQRTTLLSDKAVFHIREYIKEREAKNIISDRLFCSNHTVDGVYTPMTKTTIQYIVKQIGKRAGVDRLHPHLFRHTMATHSLNGGMDIDMVGGLLGHANINNTRIYAKRDISFSNYKALVCK